ncbi:MULTISPECIES: YcjF family protein [unclassified Agarivorans]|uniref:YcjF family protein n=1 Tax=unclassified Agarivorans TaxID=2636026 RepID=UPI0026E11C7C|nr:MULTISPECIES: TIGR01620 family protein [unclassified Agarivorans]MDO6687287.1 TIGR01620 family protein [Agarivorans sp. 3_MG-2023]MDO6716945.1 TIGR01620 family protein [Agarivorans sp. 2_MG-2023]
MNPPIKQRQVLNAEQDANTPLNQEEAPLASKQVIDDTDWQQDPEIADLEPLDIELTPQKTSPWLKYGFGAAVVIAIGELALSLAELWQSSPTRAAIYSVVLASIVGGLLTIAVRELAKLRRLKKFQKEHQLGEHYLEQATSDSSKARTYCENLAKLQGLSDSQEYLTWKNWLNDSHSSSEIVSLYSDTVLTPLDNRAKQAISKWSGEAAVLVAISPLALVDMLIIFWRNIKMIESVAQIYGIELGYLSRIRLIKSVFANMIYAAASEVITDVGSDLLGAELTAKLSGKAAQGIGAGLLTARLGFKTMEQCRPVPWTLNNKPKTKQLKSILIERVKQKLSA